MVSMLVIGMTYDEDVTNYKEMMNMTGDKMRNSPLFMRNTFPTSGKYGIPVIRKQELDINDVKLISCTDTKSNDSAKKRACGVHFFVDDYRFNGIYNNPSRSLNKYSQYAFLLSPDFSTYADMRMWRQIESVAKNRWCGAYWQDNGLTVIPTISWSNSMSFDFCFDGVERNATVAVGMIGCKSSRTAFMRGYNAMLERLDPSLIICFGKPYDEMKGNLFVANYAESRTGVNC